MKLQINDPRLLQYVLNEISSTDRLIVDTAIENQPEIQAEVVELKRVYGTIEDIELSPKNMSLSNERRQKLFQQTIYKKSSSSWSWIFDFKKWSYAAGGLIAATFALLVFNHSLKKEVSTASIDTSRPTIPADSDMQSDSKTVSMAESDAGASPTQNENSIPTIDSAPADPPLAAAAPTPAPAPTAPTNVAVQDKDSVKDLAEEKEFAKPEAESTVANNDSVAELSGTNEKLAPQKAATLSDIAAAPEEKPLDTGSLQKKKMFAPSKQSGSANMKGAAMAARDENSDVTNSGLLSAFGSGGVRKKLDEMKKETAIKTDSLQVFISSRALEAEQIKTMTNFINSCLQQFNITRELKITFEIAEKKYTFAQSNPTDPEKNFALCAQRAFVQPLAPYIQLITVELKSVSK